MTTASVCPFRKKLFQSREISKNKCVGQIKKRKKTKLRIKKHVPTLIAVVLWHLCAVPSLFIILSFLMSMKG